MRGAASAAQGDHEADGAGQRDQHQARITGSHDLEDALRPQRRGGGRDEIADDAPTTVGAAHAHGGGEGITVGGDGGRTRPALSTGAGEIGDEPGLLQTRGFGAQRLGAERRAAGDEKYAGRVRGGGRPEKEFHRGVVRLEAREMAGERFRLGGSRRFEHGRETVRHEGRAGLDDLEARGFALHLQRAHEAIDQERRGDEHRDQHDELDDGGASAGLEVMGQAFVVRHRVQFCGGRAGTARRHGPEAPRVL